MNSVSSNSILSKNNLQATSTTLLNKTNFSNFFFPGNSTLSSSLNVSGPKTSDKITTINSTSNVEVV
jgi:hypothetical protein